MLIRLRSLRERLQDSLFWVPTLWVITMSVAAQVLVSLDTRITDGEIDSPVAFTSTVDATRILLSTIAGATISFAGVAFSIALLTLQLASSQFSPRLIQQMFRDKFDKRIIGFVIGTFAYCLVVLRAVRGPLEEGGTSVIPNISVAVGLVLGMLSVLAVVAFINHAAHQMDINRLLAELTERSLEVVDSECGPGGSEGESASDAGDIALAASLPEQPGRLVRSSRLGWVQAIDIDRILRGLPPGGTVVVWTSVGAHIGRDVLVATVSFGAGEPIDEDKASVVFAMVDDAVARGDHRTFDFDIRYGLRQMVDVALKAMSPGINDPTTAHEAINRAASVLVVLLQRELPPRQHHGTDGRRVVLGAQATHADLVALAYDELRSTTAGNPTVSIYLLSAMAQIVEVLESADLSGRADLLRRQARLIGEMAEDTGMHPEDLAAVQAEVQRVQDGRALELGALGIGGDPAAGSVT